MMRAQLAKSLSSVVYLALVPILCGCHDDGSKPPKSSSISPRISTTPSTTTSGASACLLADAYGADPTGGIDSKPAVTSALAALGGNGGCIQFGAGKYRFDSPLPYTFPASAPFSVSMFGAGQDATILYWPSGSGIVYNMSNSRHSFHFSSLTFSTGGRGGTTAVFAQNSVQEGNFGQNDFSRVTFRGDDGGQASQYWGFGVYLSGVSNALFDGNLFYGEATGNLGVGLSVNGVASGGNKYGIVYNVSNTGFFNEGVGFQYGPYIQGVQISNTNFTNGNTGIYSPPGQAGVLSQLSVTNSQFNTSANQINLGTEIDQVSLSNNYFYVSAGNTGVLCTRCAGLTALGNNFTYDNPMKSGQNAIIIGTVVNNQPSVISGNTFQGQTTAIWLQTASTNVTVLGNAYVNNITNVTNNGTGNSIGVATP
ncbi:hypothetical protein [Asticcacaulis sp. 201]|uniref:hypothetical protein n=1 Tax=Asticcacaulis sp. 201 TaxID=3028787 RepID=UPI00291660B4|nr:hypothetical protein [Asticcacaulis sp. 201]MDV6331321.1 hypothetical protein [Asticcacaulis sp. 201]